MFTMDDLFEIAIKLEKNGETVYTRAIEKNKNIALKPLLEWMASEEASHGQWFSDQKRKLCLERDEADLKKMVPQALQDMMGEKTLSLDEINFNEITTVSQLLETFIGFENETIDFYQVLELFIEEASILTGLKKIIQEEKTHVEKLNSMMLFLSKNV